MIKLNEVTYGTQTSKKPPFFSILVEGLAHFVSGSLAQHYAICILLFPARFNDSTSACNTALREGFKMNINKF